MLSQDMKNEVDCLLATIPDDMDHDTLYKILLEENRKIKIEQKDGFYAAGAAAWLLYCKELKKQLSSSSKNNEANIVFKNSVENMLTRYADFTEETIAVALIHGCQRMCNGPMQSIGTLANIVAYLMHTIIQARKQTTTTSITIQE